MDVKSRLTEHDTANGPSPSLLVLPTSRTHQTSSNQSRLTEHVREHSIDIDEDHHDVGFHSPSHHALGSGTALRRSCLNCMENFNGEWFGNFLRYLIYLIILAHMLIGVAFVACLFAIIYCINRDLIQEESFGELRDKVMHQERVRGDPAWFFILIQAFTFPATAITVIILENYTFGIHQEIQSYQVAYFSWTIVYAVLRTIQNLIANLWKDEESEQAFSRLLLRPFGIKTQDGSKAFGWTMPLVSLAPAIVVGFLCNFYLDQPYTLDCDDQPASIPASECMAVSGLQKTEFINFIGGLASTMLGVWGMVCAVGYLISLHDPNVDFIDDQETAKQLFRALVETHEGREFMREHIQMAQQSDDEDGAGQVGRIYVRTESMWRKNALNQCI